MPDIEKLIGKMKAQPNGVRFEEVRKVLAAHGFRLVRQRGSHCFFENEAGRGFTIPERNPVKAVYVHMILTIIGEADN